jgi:hypothetical protein
LDFRIIFAGGVVPYAAAEIEVPFSCVEDYYLVESFLILKVPLGFDLI